MSEKKITMRKQKIRKNHVKEKLIFFATLTLLLLIVAAFASKICPYDPYAQDLLQAQKPPSAEHLLGTDRYGRDMLSRVLVGSTTSIYATLLLVVIVTVMGTMIGLICGWCGGIVDMVLMHISDLFLAFPSLVFALAVAAVLGGGIQNAVIALAVIGWPKFARLARGLTLAQKDSPYLMAVKMSGSSTAKILWKHVLPNIAGQILVTAVLDIGTMMMELAGLSFLGLGVQPPAAEWGSMINDGRSMLQISPWMVLAPGAAIFITVMIFNLLGDTLRDYMDPKQRAKDKKKEEERNEEKNFYSITGRNYADRRFSN